MPVDNKKTLKKCLHPSIKIIQPGLTLNWANICLPDGPDHQPLAMVHLAQLLTPYIHSQEVFRMVSVKSHRGLQLLSHGSLETLIWPKCQQMVTTCSKAWLTPLRQIQLLGPCKQIHQLPIPWNTTHKPLFRHKNQDLLEKRQLLKTINYNPNFMEKWRVYTTANNRHNNNNQLRLPNPPEVQHWLPHRLVRLTD